MTIPREDKPRVNELREATFEHLRRKGISEDQNDYVLVNDAGNYGTEEYVLRNLVAHLPNYSAKDIVETCLEATFAKLPDDDLLTDDHFIVRERLSRAYMRLNLYQRGVDSTVPDEYRKIMHYAMAHIEDGLLIVSLLYDRGIGTLDGILKFIAMVKSSSHTSLSEGVL